MISPFSPARWGAGLGKIISECMPFPCIGKLMAAEDVFFPMFGNQMSLILFFVPFTLFYD
jgi:hypothetical protein